MPRKCTRSEFAVTKHALARGLYRWPTAWRVTWQGSAGPAILTCELTSRRQIGNWFVVGFTMGITEGTLSYDGRTTPVYGLAELLMVIGR